MSKEYPPEVYELLEWFEANPGGPWEDVPQRLHDYGWEFVKLDNLHDNCGTMHSVPGLSGFGRNVLREHRRTLEAKTGQQPAKPHREPLDSLPDQAMMTHLELSKALDLPPDPLRSRLDRWRRKNFDGWHEVTERKARQPKYVYLVGAVRNVLRDAMTAEK